MENTISVYLARPAEEPRRRRRRARIAAAILVGAMAAAAMPKARNDPPRIGVHVMAPISVVRYAQLVGPPAPVPVVPKPVPAKPEPPPPSPAKAVVTPPPVVRDIVTPPPPVVRDTVAPPPPPVRLLCFDPPAIHFTTPGTQTITLTNPEPAPLRVVGIESLGRRGDTVSGYSVEASRCLRLLGAGQRCTFTITATGRALETREVMNLRVEYEDPATGQRQAARASAACSRR
jgi:hypothetical protein